MSYTEYLHQHLIRGDISDPACGKGTTVKYVVLHSEFDVQTPCQSNVVDGVTIYGRGYSDACADRHNVDGSIIPLKLFSL